MGGGYRITDPYTNALIDGERWDLDLDYVEAWLNDQVGGT
jgi:hypothetical protein